MTFKMKQFSGLLVMMVAGVVVAGANPDIYLAFLNSNIVPEVVDTAPSQYIEVKYPSGAEVFLGNELRPSRVQQRPQVSYVAHDDCYYTFAFVDPDLPAPLTGEYRHWLVGNVPGNRVCQGEVLAEYYGPAPPQGTGLHRYIFLAFKQPGILVFDEPRFNSTTTEGRDGFYIRNFAEKYCLGDPIAGNYYLAQYES